MEAKGRQIRDTVCLEFSDWPFAGRNEVLIQGRKMQFWFSFQEEFGGREAVLSGRDAEGAKGNVQVGEFGGFENVFDRLDRSLGKAIRGRVCYRR